MVNVTKKLLEENFILNSSIKMQFYKNDAIK